MKYLIIYAQEKDGHCKHILDTAKKNLKNYTVIDLYKDKFDPTLHFTKEDKIVKKYQDLIKKHDKLIFIYPIWWGTMPAILKGFFDKVFTSGFAFRYENHKPIGLLSHYALVLMTAGAPKIFYLIFRTPSQHISRLILRFCGIKSKTRIYGGARHLNKEKVEHFTVKALHKF